MKFFDNLGTLEKIIFGVGGAVIIGCLVFGTFFYQYDPGNPVPIWKVLGLSGGDSQPSPAQTATPTPEQIPSPTTGIYTPTPLPTSSSSGNEEILRIGAFNVQVFGTTKASKHEVMTVLARIIRTYDIIAIQEIRDASQTALPALVDLVNSDGSQFSYVVSERLGRTTSKEQYAYIYNTQTILLVGTPQTYPEPEGTDPFHREPYIAPFKAHSGNFDVTAMVIHTDPEEATGEINELDSVVSYARSAYPGEKDFIVIGDLNADCTYFDEDSSSTLSSSDYYWCIDNNVDTTTKTTDCTYDRIIITRDAVSDFTGDAGVFRFDREYGLTIDETTAISDHYPVYALFYSNRDVDTAMHTPSPSSTSTPTPKPTPIITTTGVHISDLDLQNEWVKITNSGSSPVTLTGWRIMDEGEKHTYIFPPFTLSSGATVTLYTVQGTDSATELYWGRSLKSAVWNNEGDTASLYDASGTLIDRMEK
jgi:endonuclease/exonuclease/phosphatase family metal-dependent hydrolase